MWRVLRSARRHPLTTGVAILSLALGIGVNTAVFSLADALFLRPLDVSEPGRLVFASARADAGRPAALSYPEYEDVAREASVFAGAMAYDERATTWRAEDRLGLLLLSAVTSNYFDVLGVHPALGRTFDAARDRDLPSSPVVLSHSLWARHLGSDAAIIGRPVRLGDRPYTVIGVLPASFTGLQRGTITDVYIDLNTWARSYGRRENLSNRGARHFTVLARLAPGASHDPSRALRWD